MFLLAACVQGETLWFQSCKSITVDECFYLNLGIQTACELRLDPALSHAGVAPLPVVQLYVPTLCGSHVEPSPGLWTGRFDAPVLIDWPRRLNVWLNGFPLLALVYRWCRSRHGSVAGLSACVILGLSPTFLAHIAIATTDACAGLFFALTVFLAEQFWRHPSRRWHVVWLLSLSLAMSAKYSNIILLPHMLLILAFHRRLERQVPVEASQRGDALPATYLHTLLPSLLVIGSVSTLTWALHAFQWTSTTTCLTTASEPYTEATSHPEWPVSPGRPASDSGAPNVRLLPTRWMPQDLPSPLTGLLNQHRHNQAGHPTFLLGERSLSGWPAWFPLAFAMKSTPVELVLAVLWLGGMAGGWVSVWRVCRQRMTHTVDNDRVDTDRVVQLLAGVLFAVMLSTSRIQIGHRYLLPLYPLMLVGGLGCLFRMRLSASSRNRLCMLLILAQGLSNLSSAPHFLSYFNCFWGGSTNGWRLLSDSNVDWGQDLPALRQRLEQSGYPHTTVVHFGNAVPGSYGIDSRPLCDCRSTSVDRPTEDTECLAISATALQGVYFGQADPFRGFRQLPPDMVAAHSIFLYRIDTPSRRTLLRQARQLLCGTPGLITSRNPFHDGLTCSRPAPRPLSRLLRVHERRNRPSNHKQSAP